VIHATAAQLDGNAAHSWRKASQLGGRGVVDGSHNIAVGAQGITNGAQGTAVGVQGSAVGGTNDSNSNSRSIDDKTPTEQSTIPPTHVYRHHNQVMSACGNQTESGLSDTTTPCGI